ncbi:MAG: carboxypeptidase regulatory-like domain-containing protein [Planctomycetaceae bacterium]|nr:carboxypeptidase regulatory-like domain-containing protein [Planctomycetaceae bacterium]
MGLLGFLFGKNCPDAKKSDIRIVAEPQPHFFMAPQTHQEIKRLGKQRACRFEEMEQREMLSVNPLQFGTVYYEEPSAVGRDDSGDIFHITWNGGVEDTQLKQVVISLDKNNNGIIDPGECFFDDGNTNGLGVYGNCGFTLVSSNGVGGYQVHLSDDKMTLTITFDNFEADGEFVFMIDVDEMGENGLVSALAEGKEFEGSRVTATFENTYYQTVDVITTYFDVFTDPSNPGLNLPDDDYNFPNGKSDHVLTAGAFGSRTQTPKPVTISGNVYEDTNKDNVFNTGESGISGVSLELWVWDDTAGSYKSTGLSAVTDANGRYEFNSSSLMPGKYRVVETQPNGYLSVGSAPGTVNGLTGGFSETVDIIKDITLRGGESSIDNNFGEIRPGSISGYVYEDNNDNGLRETGEAGIGNVTVTLWVLDGNTYRQVGTATTDANGFYKFENLDPNLTYMVAETQPSAYLDGKERVGSLGGTLSENDKISAIYVPYAQNGTEYNFGEIKPSSLSGYVAYDANRNNQFDSDDVRLGGVTVYLLDGNGDRIAQTVTDSSGYYEFTGLLPGVYTIQEVQPAGYYDGSDFAGSLGGSLNPPDTISDIYIVTAGSHGTNYNFLEKLGGSIEGNVYEDDNNNGLIDTGEKGIPDVVVELYDKDGNKIAEVTTDENGHYKFDNLEPDKEYVVKEKQPEGYCDGKDTPGTNGGTALLPPGDEISQIFVGAGEEVKDYNFGELKYSSIAGYVYEDMNDNGIRETGEPGIAGVTVQLWVWDDTAGQYVQTSRTAVTDADGHYEFTDICPYKQFRVVEVQPQDYVSGKNTAGTVNAQTVGTASDPSDWITEIILGTDQHGMEYNFGELKTASVSGYVYEDLTRGADGRSDTSLGTAAKTDNGVRDSGEKGIADVTVTLYKYVNGEYVLYATTTTDANGYYSFGNLRPGDYKIVETQPEDYFDGQDAVGSLGGTLADDVISGITIVSGSLGTEYDFGELPPATISGYVFQDGSVIVYPQGTQKPDVNDVRDGQLTSDDKPLAGVIITLADESGAPILDEDGQPITTVTDAGGYYAFEGLAPDTYSLIISQPGGNYEKGINTPGSLGGLALTERDLQNMTPEMLGELQGLGILGDFGTLSDKIVGISVGYGDTSLMNNFSEVLYNSSVTPPPPLVRPPSPPVYPGPPSMPLGGAPGYMGTIVTPPTEQIMLTPGVGGGGSVTAYTWHLSVINGGSPRSVLTQADEVGYRANGHYITVAWTQYQMDRTEWVIRNDSGHILQRYRFGPGFGRAVAGDFNGDGIDEIAIFADGVWYIDMNGNGVWDDNDLWAQLGSAADQPVVGDWDGDGKMDIGIFGPAWEGDSLAVTRDPGLPSDLNEVKTGLRPKNVPPSEQEATSGYRAMKHRNKGRVRMDVIDHVFQYGSEADIAIAGDFSGDGTTQIGVYRQGDWYIDYNGNGRWDNGDVYIAKQGQEGDIPIVGDFTGEGIDRIGLYTPSTGRVIIDSNGDFRLGESDRIFYLEGMDQDSFPVVGDFNGDGLDEIVTVKHLEKIPLQTHVKPVPSGTPTQSYETLPSVGIPVSDGLDLEFPQNSEVIIQGSAVSNRY